MNKYAKGLIYNVIPNELIGLYFYIKCVVEGISSDHITNMGKKKAGGLTMITDILMIAVMIPIVITLLSGITSDDPTVTAILAIMPVLIIMNLLGDLL